MRRFKFACGNPQQRRLPYAIGTDQFCLPLVKDGETALMTVRCGNLTVALRSARSIEDTCST